MSWSSANLTFRAEFKQWDSWCSLEHQFNLLPHQRDVYKQDNPQALGFPPFHVPLPARRSVNPETTSDEATVIIITPLSKNVWQYWEFYSTTPPCNTVMRSIPLPTQHFIRLHLVKYNYCNFFLTLECNGRLSFTSFAFLQHYTFCPISGLPQSHNAL